MIIYPEVYFCSVSDASVCVVSTAASYKLLPGVQRERETAVSFILNLYYKPLVIGDLLNVKIHPCVISRLNTNECFTLGDVTTINMTMVKGGVAYNVVPAEMDVSFDLRIPPTVNLQVCIWTITCDPIRSSVTPSSICKSFFMAFNWFFRHVSPPILFTVQEFEEKIKAWCKEAGEDVTYDFAQVRFIFTPQTQFHLAWSHIWSFYVSARRQWPRAHCKDSGVTPAFKYGDEFSKLSSVLTLETVMIDTMLTVACDILCVWSHYF